MISKKTSIKLMIGLLSIVILFHLCVLLGVISYEVVWAGKLNSKEEMFVFETVSILLNFLLIITFYIKLQNIKKNVQNRVVNIIIWIFVFLFALNTIGNIFANSLIEQFLGTFLTFVSSILCWVIVKKENHRNANIA